MKKIVRLNERDLTKLVRKIISEQQSAVPFGYEENNPQKKLNDYYVNVTKETLSKLPENLRQFVISYKLLNYGQLQMNANGDQFKYIIKANSETVIFSLNEFNKYYPLKLVSQRLEKEYAELETQYGKIEALYDKFDNLIPEE